jgi:3-hydroxybutyryl-CoA dehydratase
MVEHHSDTSSAIEVGQRFSLTHTFSEDQASAFALAAGDHNPLHHDADYAARTRFGRLIVSGTQTTALLMGLAASHFSRTGEAVGANFSVDLLQPVFSDEQVVLEWIVVAIHSHQRHGRWVEIQGTMKGIDGKIRVRARGRVLAW